ncbi:hypothetical protein ABFA07_013954 [Porites harrisoni]
MIATEFFQCKKGSPDRGKIWESIQERLNKLDNPKFMIKEKRGVRDRWNLLQAKFKRTQREELQASGIDCELSEKDTLIEELCEREDSFSAKDKKKSDDKEAAEEIRKKAMERMKRKSTESAGGSAKKSRRSGGDAVEFLKEKAQSEYSIRQQELELQRKEQEVRARQQELQIELLRKQTEQQVQISQALMTMMQNMVKK